MPDHNKSEKVGDRSKPLFPGDYSNKPGGEPYEPGNPENSRGPVHEPRDPQNPGVPLSAAKSACSRAIVALPI
jgi:hypothetical protein